MSEINFFTEDDICFHLFALKKLALADGVYDDSEKQFIEQITQVYKSYYPDLDYESTVNKDLSDEQFTQGLEKLKQSVTRSRLFLKDLISLGHADGDYSEPERKMVRDAAQKLNVSEDAVRLLEKAVDDIVRATLFLSDAVYSND